MNTTSINYISYEDDIAIKSQLDIYIQSFPIIKEYNRIIMNFCNKVKATNIRAFSGNNWVTINIDNKYVFKIPYKENKFTKKPTNLENEIKNQLFLFENINNKDRLTKIVEYRLGDHPYYIQTVARWRSLAKHALDKLYSENNIIINDLKNFLNDKNLPLSVKVKLSNIIIQTKTDLFNNLHNSEIAYLLWANGIDNDFLNDCYLDFNKEDKTNYTLDRLKEVFWNDAQYILEQIDLFKKEAKLLWIIHNDLNSQNIFFDKNNRSIKFIDFSESERML